MYERVIDLKSANPNLKVLIAVGGKWKKFLIYLFKAFKKSLKYYKDGIWAQVKFEFNLID